MQRCPRCDEEIPSDQINMTEGMALCPTCGQLSKLTQLRLNKQPIQEVLDSLPPGCSLTTDGQRVIVEVSLYRFSQFVLMTGIALFWNSLVVLMLTTALGGLYANWLGPLPPWAPVPGMKDGFPQMNDKPMGIQATAIMFMFAIPFLIIGMGLVVAALLPLWGKIRVMIDETRSSVATGIGPFTWKHRFDAHHVQDVMVGNASWTENEEVVKSIVLQADRTIKFASLIKDAQFDWLYGVMKAILKPSSFGPHLPDFTRPDWLARKQSSFSRSDSL